MTNIDYNVYCFTCGNRRGDHYSCHEGNKLVVYCFAKGTPEWRPYYQFKSEEEIKLKEKNPNLLFKIRKRLHG